MADETILLGKYRILAELGRGGFATVYKALDTTLNREVALKILHPQLLADPHFVRQFRQEAQTVAGLRHQHIITIYEISEADGRIFIAMELVRGLSLATSITRRKRIPWGETLALLKPICEALDYAHGRGIVHRDLKPANILLDKDRGALLTDFGFARLLAENSMSVSLSGGIVGTPGYIAPEVWESNAADPPVDIYALGCIVYEMLTGDLLFKGQTPMQAVYAHSRGPQFPDTWPDGVPSGIATVVGKALAREPTARYTSAIGLWHALNELAQQARATNDGAQKATVVAQWRAEAERALANREWDVARMALGRWLAVAPDDPEAKAFQAKLAPPPATPTSQNATPPTPAAPVVQNATSVTSSSAPAAPAIQNATSRRRPLLLSMLGLGGAVALVVIAYATGLMSGIFGNPMATPTGPAAATPASDATSTVAPAAAPTVSATTPATPTRPAQQPTPAPAANTPAPAVSPPTPTPSPTEQPATPQPAPETAQEQIAFGSDRDDRRGEIYLINADGSGLERLTNSPGADEGPAWSPDGSQIAFQSDHDGDYEIYVMNADGSERTQLTSNNSIRDMDPAWSPDGTRLVFQSDRDTPLGSFEIYVMNADGSAPTRLTDDPEYDGCPVWSTDGARVAFLSNRNGSGGIYVMNADGTEPQLLADDGACPAWSPDGNRIVFTSNRDGNSEIYVMNADGSGQANLSQQPAFDYGPAWSPDGTQIAFWSQRDGNSELYVMNADGSRQINVTNNPAGDSGPAWRPRSS
jgi:serine/threonine protein kinase/sugar lactone lactonase YvrE